MKKLLSVLGLLALSTPVSLAVVSCGKPRIIENIERKIVDAIGHTATFLIRIGINSAIEDLENIVKPDFIKKYLDEELANKFDNSLFSLNKITHENDENLLPSDLISEKLLVTKINYNYGEIKGQTAKLTIDIKVLEEQIVQAINSIEHVLDFKIVGTPDIREIFESINGIFITKQLPEEIAKAFKFELFHLDRVTNENGEDLTVADIIHPGDIKTHMIYNYGEIKNQIANLTIKKFI